MNKIALDTNVIVYSHNGDDAEKRACARNLLNGAPVISSHVISEYLNVMRCVFKMEKRVLINMCTLWLESCHIQPVVFSTIDTARRLISRYDFQLYDSIIVASALEAKCDILYSEDMQNGQVIDGTLKIVNPFI